jgi:hypothetical protein
MQIRYLILAPMPRRPRPNSQFETNGHMISINETLGYYVLGQPARSWELQAARVGPTAQS